MKSRAEHDPSDHPTMQLLSHFSACDCIDDGPDNVVVEKLGSGKRPTSSSCIFGQHPGRDNAEAHAHGQNKRGFNT